MLSIPYRAGAWASPYDAIAFAAHAVYDYGFFSFSSDASTNSGVAGHQNYYTAGSCYSMTRDGATVWFYRDGDLYAGTSVNLGVTTSPDFSNRQPVMIQNRHVDTPSEGYIGDCAIAIAWNRALSAKEHQLAFLNPWQVFA